MPGLRPAVRRAQNQPEVEETLLPRPQSGGLPDRQFQFKAIVRLLVEDVVPLGPGKVGDEMFRTVRRQCRLPRRDAPAVDRHLPFEFAIGEVGETAAVDDGDQPRSGIDRPELRRLRQFFEFIQPRMRRSVREHQSVGDEVGVVRFIAEVAAVHPVLPPGIIFPGNTVVDPLPDEAALQPVAAAEGVEVVRKAAVAVAHRVGEFTEDHRPFVVGRIGGPVDDGPHIRIHRRNDVGKFAVEIGQPAPLLRIDRPLAEKDPRWIDPANPRRRCRVIGADSRLVAERPDDHRGVVPVARDQMDRPVHVGEGPRRIHAQIVEEGVVLDVRLVENVEAVFVAELIKLRGVRIVAGADGVDVEALHKFDVPPHGFEREGPAGVRIVFVAVDAADQHRFAVDPQFAMGHLHPAESHPAAGEIHLAPLPVAERHRQPVEEGIFGAPVARARQFQPEPGVEAARVLEVEIPFEPFPGGDGALGCEHFAPGVIIEPDQEKPPLLRCGGADLGHAVALPGKSARDVQSGDKFQIEQPGPERFIQRGGGEEILDVILRHGVKRNAADNSGVPPLVLILDVARVGELAHHHRQQILPGMH